MTEKLYSLNLASHLIGNPTLISSTLSTHSKLTSAVELINVHDSNRPLNDLNDSSHLPGIDSSDDLSAPVSGTITAQLKVQILPINAIAASTLSTTTAADTNTTNTTSVINSPSILLTSQVSTTSNDMVTNGNTNNSIALVNKPPMVAQNIAGKSCRFPKLEECAHFHYERVQLGPLTVRLIDDKSDLVNSSIASQSICGDTAGTTINMSNEGVIHHQTNLNAFTAANCWFIIKVLPHRSDSFFIKRSFDNVRMLDEMLHRCVYDRKISGLKNLDVVDFKCEEDVEYAVAKYLERFSKIASDSLTCGTILTWFQLDNKGRRLPLADGDTMRSINTPAVGAAYGVRRYQAQASDEISIEVGDMISVIDMPSPAESIWWRGKKSHLQKSHYEVGFFPQSCVATIGDKVPRHFPLPAPLVGQVDISPTKPVLRKHGKLIAFFRSFILSRPSRRRLKQTGIYRERVFSCDLSEHLLNSGQEIPMVLKCCAEFIEEYGIVDGIYRLSGITSNIQRLRQAFDEERVPDLGNPEMKQDIHAVSSLLKMYFRELPNPLCTYQLYDNFVEAIQAKSESSERLRLMKETVLKLPPPHYRTLKYLSEHLNKICQHAERTGMTDKNLAIVWAPNLLRSPALESGGVAALRGVGVQAVVTEYLIKNCYQIFDGLEDANIRSIYAASSQSTQATCSDNRTESFMDCESLLVEQREHDQQLLSYSERPKSLSAGGAKLISLEEAQERHLKLDNMDLKQSIPINMINSVNAGHNIGSYIEVGGGPSSLPDKYHTVLSVPRSWQKRKTHSWKSLFTRQQRPVSNGAVQDLKSSTAATMKNQGDINNKVIGRSGSTHVTFDDVSDGIATNKKTAKLVLNRRDDKHKSIEIFETSRSYSGEPSKPIELRVRSNSIDSLRIGGHSRSVSHDSYFDLLQSPQRAHVNTCPSRELSELGLNFDREEPEMRIFSESESLVSSPRVGKENIPPSSCATLRRIMRARPEEYSSQTNSVNPSPKKQPRLNLLLSPDSAPNANWSPNSVDTFNNDGHIDNESCSKRYKLEDQLSDIQYIDSGTPEHIVSNSSSLYSTAQVSSSTITSPPLYTSKDSTTQKIREFSKKMISKNTNPVSNTAQTRYSYPSVPLGSKRKELDHAFDINTGTKERFSYPGSIINDCDYYPKQSQSTESKQHDMKIKMSDNCVNQTSRNVTFGGCQSGANVTVQHLDVKSTCCDLLKVKNRKNLPIASDKVQMSGYSTEYLDDNGHHKINDDFNKVKLTVTTPTSPPIQSPRYSLLVGGDTSSENSSNINTPPQHELEPLMLTSAVSALSGISTTSSNHMPLLLNVDSSSCLGTSRESLSSNLAERRDMQAVKRELSLDLNAPSTKLNATDPNLQAVHRSTQNLVSPNNSNFTDNTSQSVTPSEFGYQNLHRQLSMHSLIETDDNSPVYEEYEPSSNHLNSPIKLSSPIRATINITYNVKKPPRNDFNERSVEHKNNDGQQQQQEKQLSLANKSILETCFDDTIIYEKVKFLRNSVTEINQLMNEDRVKYFNTELENLTEVEELSDCENSDAFESQWRHQDEDNLTEDKQHLISSNQEDDKREDILVNPNEGNLLYENVDIRKPASIYQNLMGEDMKSNSEKNHLDAELELDSLDSIKEAENEIIALTTAARRSPSNLSVKELATKFETSPVEQMPAFDFSQISRSSIRKTLNSVHVTAISRSLNDNEDVNSNIHAKPPKPPQASCNQKTKLRKAQQQITRSLDEDAFVREFNTRNIQDLTNSKNKFIQQAPAVGTFTDSNNRRKSFDFTRPKTLNPPKRLPGVPITEEALYMNVTKPYSHRMDSPKSGNSANSNNLTDYHSIEMEKKCSAYNENNALALQYNTVNNTPQKTYETVAVSTLPNNLHVLSGVKLDRERIDRIKEERRQQLTQKYHIDLLKSKSKTDLNSYRNDEYKFDMDASLRIKSKSRADMHNLQKDMDNLKEFGRNPPSTAVSETTLNIRQRTHTTADSDKSYSGHQSNEAEKAGVLKAKDMQQYRSQTNSLHNNLYNSYQMEDFCKRGTAVQKFERKSVDFAVNSKRERQRSAADNSIPTTIASNANSMDNNTRSSINSSIREKISPQFSIKDVTAMFESRSQHQQSQQ